MASALTIAGLDPSGGAGVLADVRIFASHGVNAFAVASALTVQDSRGVRRVQAVPRAILRRQIKTLLRDSRIAAAKTGLLPDARIIRVVSECLPKKLPLVVDPVLASSGGFRFLSEAAIQVLKERLISRAALVTPNRRELSSLSGLPVRSEKDLAKAARALLGLGAKAVLVTGGETRQGEAVDTLYDSQGRREYRLSRVRRSVHGTGCALSAAITARLALGRPLREAILAAKKDVHARILRSRAFGLGRPILDFGI